MIKLKKTFLALAIAALTLAGHSQIKVELKVNQPIGSISKLTRYEGKNLVDIDSCRPSLQGIYEFNIPNNSPKGIYKITIGKGASFDFIVASDSSIIFETYSFAVDDSLKVLCSNDNKIFISFRRIQQKAEQKRWLIESLRKHYTEPSMFSQMLDNEYQRIGLDLYLQGNNLASKASSTLVSSAIRLELTPQLVDGVDECDIKQQQCDAWWQGIDLTNGDVRFLPKLTARLWDFLENLLCENRYTKEEQDSVLSIYIHKLLNMPMHPDVKTLMLNSLCNGFAESDYYNVIFALQRFSNNSTCPIFNETELKAKLLLESELLPGKKVYDFSYTPEGKRKNQKLSKTASKYTLIVFWSVWCPHCTESIPLIYEIYKQFAGKGFDVIAVCIDDEEDAFSNYIKQNGLDWKNIRIPYSSNSPMLIRYNVDETPKMFLVNGKLNIVSRPSTPSHLRVFLEKKL